MPADSPDSLDDAETVPPAEECERIRQVLLEVRQDETLRVDLVDGNFRITIRRGEKLDRIARVDLEPWLLPTFWRRPDLTCREVWAELERALPRMPPYERMHP